ncbi:hypothetical protein Hamer_G000395 [Homarus americanus]|uniref:Uncharacterized protein n=2 Tax=Homarus americanus TaxID=6706 RepID=A0A8J5TKR6_HOMAM|nr:hypothetical protein Hamer_G000395 [Homarus americanus]
MTGCGCEAWRGSAGHQRATASGPSERCFVHHVGQIIFALITCHLRSQPEGSVPPCSPVNTLRSLKHLYSPTLLRLLSRTLAGGVSVAWGVMGGGGEGRVAVRAFQWETQWEQLDPCPEAEWPLSGAEALFTDLPSVPQPSERPINKYTSNITVSRCYSTTATATVIHEGNSERDIKPSPESQGPKDHIVKNSDAGIMAGFLHDSAPVQLVQVVVMAAERIMALRPGSTLVEAIYSSPHRLIQHVMTAQKKHLKTK